MPILKMKTYIKSMIVAAAAATAMGAAAQNLESGYFVDNYTYRYQLNPAFGLDRNFVAMPALGNLNFGLNGTLGVGDVLYNVGGKTVTFLHPDVSTAKVLSNIGNHNTFSFDMRETLLAGGFKAWGGYNTVTIDARAGVGIKVPGALFTMLKEGISNKEYEIANFKGHADAYVTLALNHSRQINKEWRVGGALKLQFGGANADIDLRKANLKLGEDQWTISSDGDIRVNAKGFKYETKVNENTNHRYVSGAKLDNPGLGGFGVAFDLGAVYTPKSLPVLSDFEFSAAILDLGFISWSDDALATTNGTQTFTTADYTFSVDDEAPNSFKHEFDKIKDDISKIYELEDKGNVGGRARMMGLTFNIGAKYTLPVYRKVSFGLLNTTRVQSNFNWTEFRISGNIAPCKVFDAGINMSAGTFGVGLGWLINLHCPGFNFFAGMDHIPFKYAKQGVPLTSNASLNLGINFLF